MLLHLTSAATLPCKNKILVLHLQCNIRTNVASKFTGSNLTNYSMEDTATRRFETYSRNRMDRARLDRAIIRQCCHHPSACINASAILNTVFRLTHHSDSDFCCCFWSTEQFGTNMLICPSTIMLWCNNIASISFSRGEVAAVIRSGGYSLRQYSGITFAMLLAEDYNKAYEFVSYVQTTVGPFSRTQHTLPATRARQQTCNSRASRKISRITSSAPSSRKSSTIVL